MAKKPSPKEQPRVIRVFVSSTFRDMQAERDELIKFIFPKLRKLCEQRGVTWGEVDLRWGITEEQKAEGNVLPICLNEIQRCRPYFIGLLGERYGWIPDEISKKLIAQEPWLDKHCNRSVTELEILHGVLNNPEMAEHAFFYFRDPNYINTLPKSRQSAFREEATAEEIKDFGKNEAERRAQVRRDKLAALKSAISISGFPVKLEYKTPTQLGECVLRDLTLVIERLYPEDSQPTPLDREFMDHEMFAASRARVYIGREAYDKRLEKHVQGDGQPLVVLGESGMGKSALLANWALKHRTKHSNELVLMHFIGATPGSTDWMTMVRRILEELQRKFDIQEKIPDQPDALRGAFTDWLHMAAAKGKVILILDALNQLEDRDGAQDLVWLPLELPVNIRLVLSTLPGGPLDELQKRGWPTLNVEPLELGERERLIKDYLGLFTKSLSTALTERIAGASQCRNPFFLRALLDELRLFGVHEKLDQRIQSYLKADDIPALYKKILARYEQDYERDRPGLVRDSMSLIWAARRGLSEVELFELLGTQGKPLPGAYWSPLSLALEGSLLSRNGLICFAHDFMRQAIESRYLPAAKAQKDIHLKLADYFKRSVMSLRKVEEEPWQLAQSKDWDQLYLLLGDSAFAYAVSYVDINQLQMYWSLIEANSKHQMVLGYKQVLDAPSRFPLHEILTISTMLFRSGHFSEASTLNQYMMKHYRQAKDHTNLAGISMNQAGILRARGDLDGAIKLLREVEQTVRGMPNPTLHIGILNNLATILVDRGDLDGALAVLKDLDKSHVGTLDPYSIASHSLNKGVIYWKKGQLEQAMKFYKLAEKKFRELGMKDELIKSLANQGVIHKEQGDLDRAMALFKEQEQLCRELGDVLELQNSLGNQGSVLHKRGNVNQALALYKDAERICRDQGLKLPLAVWLGNQGLILKSRGNLDGAMFLFKEQEQLSREMGNQLEMLSSLNNQGGILKAKGNTEGALALYAQQEKIYKELGNHEALQRMLADHAQMHYMSGDLNAAMSLLKEGEHICRNAGNKAGLIMQLFNQAIVLQGCNDFNGAMDKYKEHEKLCRELGDNEDLAKSLTNQAVIFKNHKDWDRAIPLLKQAEQIDREGNFQNDLQVVLWNQALISKSQANWDNAMVIAEERNQLCRKLGNKHGWQETLHFLGEIYFRRGDIDKALELHRQQEVLCREIGEKDGLILALIAIAWLTGTKKNQSRIALPIAEEAYRLAIETNDSAAAKQASSLIVEIRKRV